MSEFQVQIHSVMLDGKEYFMEEVLHQDPTPLRNFFILNALGNRVWIKVNSREKAQQIVDEYYGKNFFIVKSLRGAKGAEKTTVRATATRKGQYLQSQKARILNS